MIEEAAKALGMQLIRRGENYICDCPYCGEHHTMAISPRHEAFKCFRCGEAGGAEKLLRTGEKRTNIKYN